MINDGTDFIASANKKLSKSFSKYSDLRRSTDSCLNQSLTRVGPSRSSWLGWVGPGPIVWVCVGHPGWYRMLH